jgi:hypothetical protein
MRLADLRSEAKYACSVKQTQWEVNTQPNQGWCEYHTSEVKVANKEHAVTLLHITNVNFNSNPWNKHLVQVESFGKATRLVYKAKAVTDRPKVMCNASQNIKSLTRGLPSRGKVRSLGYVGSFLFEYSSADSLCAIGSVLGQETEAANNLLRMVSAPGSQPTLVSKAVATSACRRVMDIPVDTFPANESQMYAVRELRPGLDVIHGPPGTGKSTTIWHIINS